MKPVGVPGAFCAEVDAPRVLDPVDALAAVVAGGAVVAGAEDDGEDAVVDAAVVGVLDAAEPPVPATPALRGDDEL